MTWSIFFFQAEDGIRDVAVTGVQTCALPISRGPTEMASARPSPATATACETTAPWRSTTVAVLRPATTGSLNTSTTWRGGGDRGALAERIDRCRMLWAEAGPNTTASTKAAPSA